MFSLNGHVAHIGVVEVPMGITTRQLLEAYGGMANGKRFKGIVTGGVSGGVLTEADMDAPITVDKWGDDGMLGSGASTCIDETVCIVELARMLMRFNADQSCGKCVPCRHGCIALYAIIDRITRGGGRPEDTELILSASDFIIEHSLCGLGTAAPVPIKSIIQHYRAEWDAHVLEKRCPCGVCPMTGAEPSRVADLPSGPARADDLPAASRATARDAAD
jgi:NADH:ubiquinone oxidoreductase subunit F (NADH-binding)